MTINDHAYELLEIVRRTIKDDEYIDIRLLKDFIRDQRAQLLERAFDKRKDFYRFVQTIKTNGEEYVELELFNTPATDRSGIVLLKSKIEIPTPLLLKNRYAITKVSPVDFLQDSYNFVNYDEAIYGGNGKFNKFSNFSFLRNDYLFIKANDNPESRVLSKVTVDGVFQDPLLVPGFDEDNDDYPISANMWNTLIDMVLQGKLRIKLNANEDIVNDGDDKEEEI